MIKHLIVLFNAVNNIYWLQEMRFTTIGIPSLLRRVNISVHQQIAFPRGPCHM